MYSPRLPDRLVTDKVSGGGRREYRADELVWAVLMVGLLGPVLRFMRCDVWRERFLFTRARAKKEGQLKTCGEQIY